MIWTLIEPGIAISAASLATIRPLLRRFRIGGFTSSERSGATGAYSQGQGSRIKGGTKMPGFGPQDVTGGDIELGSAYTGKQSAPSTIVPTSKFNTRNISQPPKVFSLPSDGYGTREETSTFYQSDTQRTEPTSELFMDGGQLSHSFSDTHTAGAWYDQASDASSIELNRPTNSGLTMPSPPARRL